MACLRVSIKIALRKCRVGALLRMSDCGAREWSETSDMTVLLGWVLAARADEWFGCLFFECHSHSLDYQISILLTPLTVLLVRQMQHDTRIHRHVSTVLTTFIRCRRRNNIKFDGWLYIDFMRIRKSHQLFRDLYFWLFNNRKILIFLIHRLLKGSETPHVDISCMLEKGTSRLLSAMIKWMFHGSYNTSHNCCNNEKAEKKKNENFLSRIPRVRYDISYYTIRKNRETFLVFNNFIREKKCENSEKVVLLRSISPTSLARPDGGSWDWWNWVEIRRWWAIFNGGNKLSL